MSNWPRHDAIYVNVDTEMRGLELEVEWLKGGRLGGDRRDIVECNVSSQIMRGG
jgi:hypothetical protein